MTHGPEHHLEHAEHAAHAAHDQFDKRVTISIAIIAAVLACVTMIGHRAHNETLRLQTASGHQQAAASNNWARYQAVNVRSHLYQSLLETSDFMATRPEAQSAQDRARQRWKAQWDKYELDQLPKLKDEAEKQTRQSEELHQQSEQMHAQSDRFDLGELFLQLAVVLASLAILTKTQTFWYGGLLCALVGVALAASGHFGLFMGHH
jgi:hypothetical protein